ncbi:MAG: DUF489 family protein, partial [Gammaproteobacteria bacterium]|nr:DUF489 family protein [Gammaproteobacteria bacterium]
MTRSLSDRVLALAGVVQAAALVNEVATAGRADEQSIQVTINSIIKTDAADVPEIFGGARGLRCGLQRLAALLGPEQQLTDLVVLRYTLNLLQIQGKVMGRGALKQVLEGGIK